MPGLQPFWDARYTVEDPGPYGPVSPSLAVNIDTEGALNATYTSNPWDTARIGDKPVPGIVSVSISPTRHLFVQQAPGSPPYVSPAGYEPTRFTMSVRIWTPAQWAALQPIMWLLQPDLPGLGRPPKQPKQNSGKNTFQVYHPALAVAGVSSAICLKCGPMTGEQVKTLAIEFLANRKGKSAVFTVSDAQVAAPYNAEELPKQQVQAAATGKVTIFTPTQGPQQKPSTSEVTLTPTVP